ncbi:uncharacterized protein SRS1_14948 [Sporisorium reilianum f. sp. reilianum]|uniref:Uncharacterized protein n=1 Tax=Sporisorium reilianum f. sp. reilianum TaxID=72559 RepID=A0A2N8UHQ7_9BASI|nr:uncharacterized protein SRS1_14948 [Sporisorium reilianum f. sp. reilianum]
MNLLALLAIFIAVSTSALAAGTPEKSKTVALAVPPAGRALYYRGADLEPWDYPEAVRASFDDARRVLRGHSILGPPGFWTEPSMRAHYEATAHLRYHSELYHELPPFEVWLKEKQLIAAISMMRETIDIEASRGDVKQSVLLRHEMQLGELSILFRLVGIATALRYGIMTPEVRWYEEFVYRYWSGFLTVSQQAEPTEAEWREHLAYLAQEVEEEVEEIRAEEEQAMRAAELKGAQKLKGPLRQDSGEKGRSQSPTPRRWSQATGVESSIQGTERTAGMQGSTPQSWRVPGELPSFEHGDTLKSLQEAVEKGFRL